MGKYWYQDSENKWRQGDDTDDFFAGLIIAICFAAVWVIWKPISWWLLQREEPTRGAIALWIAALTGVFILVLIIISNS